MAQRIVDHSVSLSDIAEGAKLEAEKIKKIKEKANQQLQNNKGNNNTKLKTTNSSVNRKRKKRGKKYKEALKKIDKRKEYDINSAVKLLKSIKYSKFNESVEVHINLGIDAKNNEQRIRFTTTLPNGTGKSTTVLVISDDNKGKVNNVIYRDKSVIEEIVKGKLVANKDFDIVITKPEFMKEVAKVARILGPKGIMPSPKNNTVTNDLGNAIEQFIKGQIEIKSQSGHAVLHQVVGKIDFSTKQLVENIEFLLSEITKNKPARTKKKFLEKVYIKTTMSPSIKIKV